jgi:MATE family multidrug resistance protein
MSYWYRRVFLLAIPLILSNLTQPLLSTVDTILSGHLPGPSALGGVALGGIFFNSIYWTFGFLRMATTGLVAQSHGAGDHEQILLHFSRALLLALLIGALILMVQGPLISLALSALGASPDVRRNALVYCGIRIWSAPASLANYAILGYLLGRQRARMALVLQAAINVVNVAVALFLVVGRHWGVAGVATATLIAEWSGCLVGLMLLATTGLSVAQLQWPELFHGPSLRRLFALNRDILLRTLSLVAAYAWFTRTGARSGDAILAANAVLINFHWIASYGLDGFANATEALVGEAIGANRLADYIAILKTSNIAAFLVAVFTNQSSVRTLAAQYLPWVVMLPLVSVWSFQLDGIFIGATRAPELRNSMLISFAGFMALALVLGARFGNHGLWAALLGFMSLRAITLGLRLPRIAKTSFTSLGAPASV